MSEKKIVYINEEDIQESSSSGKKLTDYDPEMQKLILDFVEHTNIKTNPNSNKLFEQKVIVEKKMKIPSMYLVKKQKKTTPRMS